MKIEDQKIEDQIRTKLKSWNSDSLANSERTY